MEVQIVGKEIIKPSSPTIKTYNLSFLDQQFYGVFYVKLYFFYKNNSVGSIEEIISERTLRLKASLSEVLNSYYPLAGKTKDKYSIHTGQDDGVEFIEARVNGTLSHYLVQPDVNLFLPKLVSDDCCESFQRPLLIIQASFFSCGGLAIGINFCHRVADAATFISFMNSWAGIAIGDYNKVGKPDFNGSLTFPPSDKFVGAEVMKDLMVEPNLVTRRVSFSKSQILGLQEKATKPGSRAPSRVQTITAFLWSISMKISKSKAGGYEVPSTLIMSKNLRSCLSPPISDQSCGNLFEIFKVQNDGGNTDISNLTSLIKEKIVEIRETYQKKIRQGEKNLIRCLQGNITDTMELAFQHARHIISISSWCSFPLYDADFGWGKPTWVANYIPKSSCIVLMDTSDGTGIEAWVCLPEVDMVLFANDEELLANATLDPSVD